MKIKFVRFRKAIAPTRAYPTDAGFDLYADIVKREKNGNLVISLGVAVEIPKGHVGLLMPRSSIFRSGYSLSNSVGVIDSGYRGELIAIFTRNNTADGKRLGYAKGDRVVQLLVVPLPSIELEETDMLPLGDRNLAGFGSTGK